MRHHFLIIAILLLFSSCYQKKNQDESKTVFRYNEASGISSLDPAFAKGQADIWACNQLFNGLLQLDDKLVIQPCIASKWTISPDNKTYTFTLRNDVFFHDDAAFTGGKGRKVIATDFEYSFNRLMDPLTASPGTWVFNYVKKDSLTGKYAFNALNDSTFSIELIQPFPPFTGLLTSLYCSVVPKEVIVKYGKDFRTHPVGTGPFKYWLWIDRTSLIFHKNENYFEEVNGRKLPFLDAVAISFINDRQSAFLEFVKGNLDFVSGLDASYKDELLTRTGTLRPKYAGKFRMETCPYLNTEYLGFLMDDSANSPLNDVRIRKAINYGFDRNRMIAYLRNGIGTPGTSGIVPPGLPSFDSSAVRGYSYHPDSSLSLLTEAGYPGGKGLPVITISTTKEYQDLCEFMQGQLSEIGIKTKLDVNQGAAHRELVAKQKLRFFRASWIADYPDAENYLSLFYSPNKAPVGPNYTHYYNLEFDKLYELASSTTNDSLRYSYYQKMDNLLMGDSPVVILYYDQVLRLYGNNISGLGKNGMNLLTLKYTTKSTGF